MSWGLSMLGQDGYNPGPEWVVVLIVIPLYFIPTIVAATRKVPNAGSVFVINFFLGWTLVGWVISLAMAARSVPPTPQQSAPVPHRSAPALSPTKTPRPGAGVTFIETGMRYRVGYTLDPPAYAIWDGERPGPPVERFPYSEHGKSEAMARFRSLEPGTAIGPGAVPPPPS